MSYANIAAQNAPPLSEQPKPDEGLLEGSHSDIASEHANQTSLPGVDGKVNVVPHDWKGETDFGHALNESEQTLRDEAASAKAKAKEASSSAKQRSKDLSEEAKAKGKKYGKKGKEELGKPEVQIGVAGVVNVAILAGVGYAMYANWGKRRWDRRVVSATVVGLGALFGSQGYLGWMFYGKDQK